TYPLAFQAWAELGFRARARSMRRAAVAYSPAKLDKQMAAIQSVSGSSLPHWMACLARRTLSSISTGDTGAPPACALRDTWHSPINAAAGAYVGAIASARSSRSTALSAPDRKGRRQIP